MHFEPQSMFVFIVAGLTIFVVAGIGGWVANSLHANRGQRFRRRSF
jgi:hypothetical protein